MSKYYADQPFFQYDGHAHIRLTPFQKTVRENVLKNIQEGAFGWEAIACLCGSPESACIAETDRYGLPIHTVICKRCGLLRTNPRLTSDSLHIFYSKYYRDLYMGPEYGSLQSYFDGMIRRGGVILTAILKALPQLDLTGKKVLEIGCSAGGILIPFFQKGGVVRGYDYDVRYINFGNKAEPKLNLKVGGLADLRNSSEKYDLIILNHVLEHLYDPIDAIQLLKKSLTGNGILYIGVPGLENPDYYFSPSKSFLGSLHIGHVYHFTRKSLESIMIGFKTLSMDDDIRAVFQRDDSVTTHEIYSECEGNLAYIKEYEYGFRSKLSRLARVVKEFPSLILPPLLCNGLRFLHKKVRGKN
jgi:2-polyprenyl-3-methyl-5-hydroxy-6-metoxy-1,4-benzoquinol methylase